MERIRFIDTSAVAHGYTTWATTDTITNINTEITDITEAISSSATRWRDSYRVGSFTTYAPGEDYFYLPLRDPTISIFNDCADDEERNSEEKKMHKITKEDIDDLLS